MTGVRQGLALLVTASVLLSGCGSGTDDELEPRPTRTVTVTGEPEPTTVPERLPFGDAAASQEVIWSEGTVLRREGTEIDLAPITPEAIVVVPDGLLVLAGGEVWFTAGREAEGQAFTEVTSLGLSEDGTQVLVQPDDRDEPVAYDVASGARVEEGVLAPRSTARGEQGPGDFQVFRRDGRASVVDRAGAAVAVDGLPADLEVSGWVDGTRPYGVGTGERGGPPRVHACDLDAAQPSCRAVGPRGGVSAPEPPVFALHPAG